MDILEGILDSWYVFLVCVECVLEWYIYMFYIGTVCIGMEQLMYIRVIKLLHNSIKLLHNSINLIWLECWLVKWF